jgi:Fic family protein
MEPDSYSDTQFGRPASRPGDTHAITYYLPRPLPRTLSFRADTVLALSEADAALGVLNGLSRLITDPEDLIGPFLTREALASSRIEGTQASLTEVLQAEGFAESEESNEDVAEVRRYLAATRQGLRLINELPISQRLFRELHRTLLQGVRGEDKLPGEIRRSPVWVGSHGATPDTARFVPPLPEHLPELLTDWETFVNEPSLLPPLVRCALMHYQFETIHPFLDGNGRIGRLLIGLMLQTDGRLHRPLLYLSGYLESHRSEYYEHLQGVRETGAIDNFLQFMLVAIRRQSDDAVARADALIELREFYHRKSAMDRSRVSALIPLMFSSPFLTVRRVAGATQVTEQGARNLLQRAESWGWLQPFARRGRGSMAIWVAPQVLAAIEAPAAYP